MRQQDWAAEVVALIAGSVRHYRKRRRMSAQQVADACRELGHDIPRSVIANLENGRRDSVSLAEWLTLAAALRVPPLLLLFPLGRAERTEVLPDVETSPWLALQWAETGQLPGLEPPFTDDAITIPKFREHVELVNAWADARHKALRARELLAEDVPADDPAELRHELAKHEQAEESSATRLRLVRRDLRDAGLDLPDLPRALQFVDKEGR